MKFFHDFIMMKMRLDEQTISSTEKMSSIFRTRKSEKNVISMKIFCIEIDI